MKWSIWIALLACLLGGYFGACHAALKTYSRSRLADVLEARGRLARLEALTLRLPRMLLATGLLRTCLGLVVVLAVLDEVQRDLPGWTPLQHHLVAFSIAGLLVAVFLVAVPVSWARYRRERLIAWSLPIIDAVAWVLAPIVAVLHVVDPVVRRISGVDLQPPDDDLTEEVLTIVADRDSGETVDQVQKDMLEAVFDLPNITAGEIMTPRTDVKGIEVDASLDEVRETIMTIGHSRIPVYEESLDHIVGMLYAKDLIRFLGDGLAFSLRDVLREPFLVPESKSVRELLADFKQRKVHIAMVLDEYGGTAGLVTIEDILEELVGEIQDEYEEQETPPEVQRIDDRSADVDARVYIDDLNDQLDIELPEDEDYDTLGGFVFAQLGHIPEAGEEFDYEAIRFTVTEAERTRVNRVRVEKLEVATAPMASEDEG